MVAALYITYGPLITMIYSAGKGAHEFVLDLRRGICSVGGEYPPERKGIDLFARRLRRDWD